MKLDVVAGRGQRLFKYNVVECEFWRRRKPRVFWAVDDVDGLKVIWGGDDVGGTRTEHTRVRDCSFSVF
jgi:hypothetical protein